MEKKTANGHNYGGNFLRGCLWDVHLINILKVHNNLMTGIFEIDDYRPQKSEYYCDFNITPRYIQPYSTLE